MNANELKHAASSLVKNGPSTVEAAMHSFTSYIEESKLDFHRNHPELVLKQRDLELEQEAKQWLISAMLTPIIVAIEKHWRHCSKPIQAKSIVNASGEVGILVTCRCCNNLKLLTGGKADGQIDIERD